MPDQERSRRAHGRAANVSSRQEMWDRELCGNPIPGKLVADLTKEQQARLRHVLDGMRRERAREDRRATLTNRDKIGIGAGQSAMEPLDGRGARDARRGTRHRHRAVRAYEQAGIGRPSRAPRQARWPFSARPVLPHSAAFPQMRALPPWCYRRSGRTTGRSTASVSAHVRLPQWLQ
jgi:hypothetical protein